MGILLLTSLAYFLQILPLAIQLVCTGGIATELTGKSFLAVLLSAVLSFIALSWSLLNSMVSLPPYIKFHRIWSWRPRPGYLFPAPELGFDVGFPFIAFVAAFLGLLGFSFRLYASIILVSTLFFLGWLWRSLRLN